MHRIFISATIPSGLSDPDTVKHSLTFDKEEWCAEIMVLIPSLTGEIPT